MTGEFLKHFYVMDNVLRLLTLHKPLCKVDTTFRSTVINATSTSRDSTKLESDLEEYSELNGTRTTETPSYLNRTETATDTKSASLYSRSDPSRLVRLSF